MVDLPKKYHTPDGAAIDKEGNLYVSIPNFNNGYLLENKIIDKPQPAAIIKIDKNNHVSEWYRFTETDAHPDTGRVGPMDLAFGPDGNLYVADIQIANDYNYKSRLIRVNVEQGIPVNTDILVEGFIASNGMLWQDDVLFVTDSMLKYEPDAYKDNGTPLYASGVYRFSLKELQQEPTITLTPYSVQKQDPHLAITLLSEKKGFGADGITADDAGYIYTGHGIEGTIYRTLLGVDDKAIETTLFEKNNVMHSTDGIVWNPKDHKIYVAGFRTNAVYAVDEQGIAEVLHQNGDTDGTDGLLDNPAEVIIRDNELIIVNMDLGNFTDTDVNSKPDAPYTISKLDLPTSIEKRNVKKEKTSRTLDDDVFTMIVQLEVTNTNYREEFEQALVEDVIGALTEEGNIAMELYQDKKNPNLYFLYEIWENRAALRKHFNEPWTQEAFAAGAKAEVKNTFHYLKDLKPLPENKIKRPEENNNAMDDLMVFFEVKPGLIDVFKKQFTEIIQYRRDNQDVISYHLYQGKDDPNKFALYERWKSKEAHVIGQKGDTNAQALFKMLDEVLVDGFALGNYPGLYKIVEISASFITPQK